MRPLSAPRARAPRCRRVFAAHHTTAVRKRLPSRENCASIHAEFATYCSLICTFQSTSLIAVEPEARKDEARRMPNRNLLPAVLTLIFYLSASSTPAALAGDQCLVKPNAPAPHGKHWYFRSDRVNKRRCWYLKSVGQSARKGRVPAKPATGATGTRAAGNKCAAAAGRNEQSARRASERRFPQSDGAGSLGRDNGLVLSAARRADGTRCAAARWGCEEQGVARGGARSGRRDRSTAATRRRCLGACGQHGAAR